MGKGGSDHHPIVGDARQNDLALAVAKEEETVVMATMTGMATVVPMEITFMDTEDEYKNYGTLRLLRYIYSNPFRFPISSLGLPSFPSQKS